MPLRFLRLNSGPTIQGRRPAFLCRPLAGLANTCRSVAHANRSLWIRCVVKNAPVGMPQENFEDLPRDECSDESLRRAQVWQRFLHSDDEHIKVERFCLICGHAEDWEKLSLGLKMKMLVNHHHHYELTSLICLGVILLPFFGHFRPILFQVSSRWYVASSRAAGNSARCTPCTDPRPAGIGVIDPGGVEIHKRSQWKQWSNTISFTKIQDFARCFCVGILEFIKLCESTHSWGDRVAWNVCCQVSDVLPLRGVLQDTATCLHCDKRRKRIGATNVWHNDFFGKKNEICT